jgi:hypothetical protein
MQDDVKLVKNRVMGGKRDMIFLCILLTLKDPFKQLGLDIIGEINPNSSKEHK